MGMNLTGLSFGMGARDVGMAAAMDGAQKGVERLNDTLETQSKIAKRSDVPGFFESIKQFNIGSIASDVRALTGDTGNLTNSMEAMAVANAKAARPFVAAMNLTGKEARKMTGRISSMAISMNIGAESVAQVFKEIQQSTGPAKEALDAFGYSEKDWVKITETTGIKVSELTDVMGGIGALWKAAPKDEAKFVNAVVEIGKKVGLGVTPLKQMKANVDALAAPFEKLPPGMQRSGKEMMDLALSGTRLAGAFRTMGSSEEEAVEQGQKTMMMFAEQAVALERAQKGLGTYEESPLYKWLTSLGLGHAKAMEIIQTGSRDAVKGTMMIQEQFQKFGKGTAQQQAMLSELSAALGESAAGLGYLAQNADSGADALSKMDQVTASGKDALRAYGNEAFSTGRTLQESLDLMKSSFETKFRSIARKDVRRFVGDLGGAYNEVAAQTKQLASDETWGPLIKRLSAANQLGFRGLIMDMEGSNKGMAKFSAIAEMGGAALGSVASSAGPVMSLFSQMSILTGPGGLLTRGFGGFVGKLGLVGLVIGGVVVGLKALSKGGEGLGKVFTKAAGWLGDLAGKARDFLANMDWAQVGKSIGGFIWSALTFIPKAIWGWITGKEAEGELGKAGGKLIENLGGAIWEAAKGLGKMLWGLGEEIVDGISEWWDSWTWDDVKQGFEDMGENIKGWWAELQTDPDFQEFQLDAVQWFQGVGWDIQDAWYNFWNNFDVGTERIADALNAEGAGEAAGAAMAEGIAEGIAAGIDRATAVSAAIRDQSERNMEAAIQAAAEFDPTQVDTAWATTTAHWMTRAADMSRGLGNSIAGFFGAAVTTAGKESDRSILDFFGNMWSTVKNSVTEFAANFHRKIQELSVGFKDLVWQLTHPEEAEKRWKQQQAKEAVDQYKQLQARTDVLKKQLEERRNIAKGHMDKWAKVQRDALARGGIGEVGVDAKGKPKSKKKIAAEQKFLAEGGAWQRTAESVASRANAVASAEGELEKLRKSGAAGADIAGAEMALKQAQTDLQAAKQAGVTAAKQAGVGATGITGVKGAMDLIVKQEEERRRNQAAILEAEGELKKLQDQTAEFGRQAATQVAEAFGGLQQNALQAGANVSTNFATGMTEQSSLDTLVYGADEAAQTVANRMTAHSPILEGPLANVGAGGATDPAFRAGRNLMESFAAGIDSTAVIVQDSIANLLEQSVLGTIDAYQVEMQKAMAKKGLLGQVAASLMNEFGGVIESTVTVEGKAENVKQQMKAMLDIPGLAGVTMAIINESAKQRELLGKISENTKAIAESDLVKKGRAAGADYVLGG